MAKIKLSKGQVALVDDADFEWLNELKWQYHYRGYAYSQTYLGGGRANPKYKKIWMHRLITDCPTDKIVDHINRDRLDNRRSNLRTCTQAQNQMNADIRCTNTSGYRGVSRLSGKWSARIRIDGVRKFLGLFDTPEEASKAYQAVAVKHYGEFITNNRSLT
jgi:hypothetical protein